MYAAGRSLFVVLFLLALGSPILAAQPPAKRAVGPAIPLKDPMVFYLAKGEPDSCGPGCDEWIAAEGTITLGTAGRMRSFLKRHGGNRPIYFYSPGGITAESIGIGRLMRERGMRAGVARTIPVGCEGDERKCAAAKRSGREIIARLTSSLSQCNSACVYAIVGAREREVAPEAHLGIHASKTVIVGYWPKNVKLPSEARTRFKAENQRQIRRYLVDMGIPAALLDEAEKVPHESVHALSREEMVRFYIDTRRVVESGWIFDDRFADKGGIFKSIDITDTNSAHYRKTMLQVSCFGRDKFLVGYAREVGPKEQSFAPVKIVAASEEFQLAPPAEPVVLKDPAKRYDVRGAPVPVAAFESAAAQKQIEIAPAMTDSKPITLKLSTIGLASAISSLSQRCGHEGRESGGAALVPRQRP